VVEFIRLNPRLLFGLSEAQLISIVLIIIGISGFVYYSSKKDFKKYIPPPIKVETKKKQNKKS
jgi:hypothetical protein